MHLRLELVRAIEAPAPPAPIDSVSVKDVAVSVCVMSPCLLCVRTQVGTAVSVIVDCGAVNTVTVRFFVPLDLGPDLNQGLDSAL